MGNILRSRVRNWHHKQISRNNYGIGTELRYVCTLCPTKRGHNGAMMDKSGGVFTTIKLQALLDCGFAAGVGNRAQLSKRLSSGEGRISVHGIEAWFRHVDSNYSHPRESLTSERLSYAIPRKRWEPLLAVFGVPGERLHLTDSEFTAWCVAEKDATAQISAQAEKAPKKSMKQKLRKRRNRISHPRSGVAVKRKRLPR